MTAKAVRKKVIRVSKAGVRIVSGRDFWTPQRLKEARGWSQPVKGERAFFRFMEAAMSAQDARKAAGAR